MEEGCNDVPSSDHEQDCKRRKVVDSSQTQDQPLKVCGPESIDTLCGRILGRDVALIVCGESHEDAIDLTRRSAIIKPVRRWSEVAPTEDKLSFEQRKAYRIKRNVSLKKAMQWATMILKQEGRDDEDGAKLVFDATEEAMLGVAYVFSDEVKPSRSGGSLANAKAYEWRDQDSAAYAFNKRRLAGEIVSMEEHDRLIVDRKLERRSEGIELFDDWLLRHCKRHNEASTNSLNVHVVLEASVSVSEVELHVEANARRTPPAHECLKTIELDSDEDSEDARDPDDGCYHFALYMLQRIREGVSSDYIHCVDSRSLGESDDALTESEVLTTQCHQEDDLEEHELHGLGADLEVQPVTKKGTRQAKSSQVPLPSWEAFFGAAADLLYYAGHVKADYVPFIVSCLGNEEKLQAFFEELYFGTLPQAIKILDVVDDEVRSTTRIRSLAYRAACNECLQRRPDDLGLVPVKAAPFERYLKARGSNPPRTWVSHLASKLRLAGGDELADAAQSFYREAALKLLADPKASDSNGDYFVAWLRECYRDVYDSIDTSDPSKLCKKESVYSPKKKQRYNIGDIRIPNLAETFAELQQFNIKDMKASSKRQRVLAKFLVDAFQLPLLDSAAILRVAHIAAKTLDSTRVAIVVYVGGDHARRMISFWKSHGFSSCEGGSIGKHHWDLNEPRSLNLPSFLHDFSLLFPSHL